MVLYSEGITNIQANTANVLQAAAMPTTT